MCRYFGLSFLILKMEQAHIRQIILFYFNKGKTANHAQKKICEVYGDGVVSVRTCQKFFANFRAGDFSLKDAPQSGSPVEADGDEIKKLLENNQRYTTQEIASIVKTSSSSVENHLQQLDYVNCFDMWLPQKLSEKDLLDRVSICDSLLKRNESIPFLKQIVTGGEKCLFYTNMEGERLWGQKSNDSLQNEPKIKLHSKVMLCIWWDWMGVLFYELLPENQTIDSIKFCSQLDRLKAAIDKKRPELVNGKGVVFYRDNDRPHVSLMTRQKLLQLDWEVLTHPPYSPDITPSDYHLFRSLQNFIDEKKLNSLEDCERHLEQFLSEKDKKFWEDGIMKLPERWQEIVKLNGKYLQ